MDIGTLSGRIELEDQMTDVLTRVNTLLDEFGKSATEQIQKAQSFGSTLTSVGKAMSIGITAPIVAFGTAAIAAGFQVESAMNTIARKSGETGDVLVALKKDFEAVFVKVPNSAQEVAVAITDVHTRLGLVGSELQRVTKQFLDFANVNQVEVAGATRMVSTLIKALELNVGDAVGVMDKLTYASQQSGISVTQLGQGVIAGGIAFKEMGFGLDESIALFAQFEKVGANVTDVTSSLHRTLANLAKVGVTDVKTAFAEMLTAIKDAPTFMDGARLSIEAFGAKAGPKLVEEIRGGTYELGGMVEALQKLTGHTDRTAAASTSFAETLGTLRNQVTLALDPIGVQLLGSFKAMVPALTEAVRFLATVTDLFSKLPQPVQMAAFAILGITAAVGPAILALGSLYKPIALLTGAAGLGSLSTAAITLGNTIPVLTARVWLLDAAARAASVGITGMNVAMTLGIPAVFLGILAYATELKEAFDKLTISQQKQMQAMTPGGVAQWSEAMRDAAKATADADIYLEDYASQLTALQDYLEQAASKTAEAAGGTHDFAAAANDAAESSLNWGESMGIIDGGLNQLIESEKALAALQQTTSADRMAMYGTEKEIAIASYQAIYEAAVKALDQGPLYEQQKAELKQHLDNQVAMWGSSWTEIAATSREGLTAFADAAEADFQRMIDSGKHFSKEVWDAQLDKIAQLKFEAANLGEVYESQMAKTAAAVKSSWSEISSGSQESLTALADAAEINYNRMLTSGQHFTREALQAQLDKVIELRWEANHLGQDYDTAMTAASRAVQSTTSDLIKQFDALQRIRTAAASVTFDREQTLPNGKVIRWIPGNEPGGGHWQDVTGEKGGGRSPTQSASPQQQQNSGGGTSTSGSYYPSVGWGGGFPSGGGGLMPAGGIPKQIPGGVGFGGGVDPTTLGSAIGSTVGTAIGTAIGAAVEPKVNTTNNVNVTMNVNGTGLDVARIANAELTRLLKMGNQFGSA